MQRNPFKFLDSFTKEDLDIFFGRELESEEIFSRLLASRLLLIYGPSGSGKSSIVQCGVSNHFADTDWKPVFIRRKDNIIQSIHSELEKHCVTPLKENASLSKKVYSLYLDLLTPVYLIFDQFEELFIFGEQKEKNEFASEIASMLSDEDMNLHIIFIVREEYLARLTEFEDRIPAIFHNRIRVEKMKHAQALMAIENPCKSVGLGIEEGIAELVVSKLERSGELELSYLQVYLDKLLKNAQHRDAENILIGHTDLEQVGEIGDILQNFLEEQISGSPDPERFRALLKTMISPQGTKKIISITEARSSLSILGHELDEEAVKAMLTFLINRRILIDLEKGNLYELRHDSLAEKIKDWLSQQEKEFIEIQSSLNKRVEDYQSRGLLLDEQFLEALLPFENKFKTNPLLLELIRKSKTKIRKQKRGRKATLVISVSSAALFLIFFVFSFFILNEKKKSDNTLAELFLEKAKNYSKENELQFVKLFGMQSLALQLKSGKSLEMNDIELPIGKQDWILDTVIKSSHTIDMNSIIFSPDEKFIATFSDGSTIRILDILNDYVINELSDSIYFHDIGTLCFSHNGKYIALAGDYGSTISIWDFEKKSIIRKLSDEDSYFNQSVASLCFSQDDKYLASCTDSGKIVIFVIDSGGKIFEDNLNYNTNTITFSSDGKLFVSGENLKIRLWSINNSLYAAHFKNKIENEKGGMTSVILSPDNRFLAYSSQDYSIKIFDLALNKDVKTLQGHKGKILSLKFSSDGRFLFSGSEDNSLKIWNTSNWEILATLHSQGSKLTSFAIDNKGKSLLIENDFGEIEYWKLLEEPYSKTLFCSNSQISSLAFSNDDQFLYAVENDSTINKWQKSNWKQINSISEIDKPKITLPEIFYTNGNVSKNQNPLEIEGDPTIIDIWKTLSWNNQTISNKEFRESENYSIIVSNDQKVLAIFDNNSIFIFDLAKGNAFIDKIELPNRENTDLSRVKVAIFGTDNKYLAWSEGTIIRKRYISADSEKNGNDFTRSNSGQKDEVTEVITLNKNSLSLAAITSLSSDPNNKFLASGSSNGRITIWDIGKDNINNPRELFSSKNIQQGKNVTSIVFSHDGKYFSSAYNDGTITVWTIKDWKILCTIKLTCKGTNSVAFSHDGKSLAVGSSDGGIIKIFNLNSLGNYLWNYENSVPGKHKIENIVKNNQRETGYRIDGIVPVSKDQISFAKNFFRNKDYLNALDRYQELINNSKSLMDDEAFYQLGYIYNKNGRLKDAIKLWEPLNVKFKDKAEFWYDLSNAYFENKNFKDAATGFENCIKLDPSYITRDLLFCLAYSYCDSTLKDYYKAIVTYKNCINLDTLNISAINNLGYCYFKIKNFSDAMSLYKKALRINEKPNLILNTNIAEMFLIYQNIDSAYYYYKQFFDKSIPDVKTAKEIIKSFDEDNYGNSELLVIGNLFKGYISKSIKDYAIAANYFKKFINEYKPEDKWRKLAYDFLNEADVMIVIQNKFGDYSFEQDHAYSISTFISAAVDNSLVGNDSATALQILGKSSKIRWEDPGERAMVYNKYITTLYLTGDYFKAIITSTELLKQDSNELFSSVLKDLQINILLDQNKPKEAFSVIKKIERDSLNDYFRYSIDKAMIMSDLRNKEQAQYYFSNALSLTSPFEYRTLWQYIKSMSYNDKPGGKVQKRINEIYNNYFILSLNKSNLLNPEEFSTYANIYIQYGNDSIKSLIEDKSVLRDKINYKNPARIKRTSDESNSYQPAREPRFSPLPEYGSEKKDISDENLNEGLKKLYSGDFNTAVENFTTSINQKKGSSDSYLYRGLAHYFLSDFDKAINDFNEALKIDPNNYSAYVNIGNINYLKQNFDIAIDNYSKALKINPVSFRIYYNRGLAKACLQDYEASVLDFDNGVMANTLNPEILHIRGLAKDYLNDLKGALHDYYQSIELNPDFTEAINHFEICKGKLTSTE